MSEKEFLTTIAYHKRMLANLKKYLTVGLILSSVSILLIVMYRHTIIGSILFTISVLWIIVVGYAIYNGNQKVNSILNQYEKELSERN